MNGLFSHCEFWLFYPTSLRSKKSIIKKHVILDMKFERFFYFISYAAVFGGFLALWVSGTFGFVATGIFVTVMVGAWYLEGSRWQISEWIGTVMIVLALPSYYFAYRFRLVSFTGDEALIAGILARMILSLSAIKLLQKKGDRDWIFLYLMSFFEVLLAAGLSISALYLVTFMGYMLVVGCAVISYDIRRTAREVKNRFDGSVSPKTSISSPPNFTLRIRKLPIVAFVLIAFILVLATPLFFFLPRVGGVGLGGNQRGLSTSTGFSDRVRLGGIGNIQQNDEIVMRVRAESETDRISEQYFRGVALDTFDKKTWSKSRNAKEPFVKGEREIIQVDNASGREKLVSQTIYLEPLDTPVLFAIPRAVAFRGNFLTLYRDAYGSVSNVAVTERSSYTVFSDRSQPSDERLRADDTSYGDGIRNYLQLPLDEDRRIFDLAYEISSGYRNRFDKAKAVEIYLRNNFGYTLDQKAGGEEPLSDFLFNVREGHCEYFASAMAIMLRSQGIATRIVNGFHGGEYNDAVDMTVIRQRHAHSWVEVYFPKENTWVTFDPTPFSSDSGPGTLGGFTGTFSKYLEALDTIWIQYFVAFDNQEQHSLARSMKTTFVGYQADISSYFGHLQDVLISEWWAELRGDKGNEARALTAGYVVGGLAGSLLIFFLLRSVYRKLRSHPIWRRIRKRLANVPGSSIVKFYDLMLRTLEEKGFVRDHSQTPLEFAYSTGDDDVILITERYNKVRFGDQDLSEDEATEIDSWLKRLKESGR